MNPPAPMCPSRAEQTLSIDDLAAFGVVPSEVRAFKQLVQSGSDPARPGPDGLTLLPLQAQALRRGVLGEGGGNLLIGAGVGTGKSVLAKLLFLHSQHSGQRSLLLLSSAAERRRARAEFSSLLPDINLPAAICSPLRLLRRLRREPGLLGGVESLIIDSLESLLKPRRRRILAALLRYLRQAGAALRVVTFVMQEALPTALSQLKATLAPEVICGPASAPPPVFQLEAGRLRPCAPGPSGAVGGSEVEAERAVTPLLSAAPTASEELCDRRAWAGEAACLRESLLSLARRGEATQVLVPQHSQRLRLLHSLLAASSPALPAAARALVELGQTAPGHGQDLLRAALSHGLALDGDELTPAQRRLVRRAQARGEVLLTLSQRLGRAHTPGTRMHNLVCWPGGEPRQAVECSTPRLGVSLAGRLRRRLSAGGRVLLVCRSLPVAERWAAALSTDGSAVPVRAAPRSRRAHLGWPNGLRFLSRSPSPQGPGGGEPLELLTRAALFYHHLPLPLLLSEPALSDYPALLLARAELGGLAERPVFRWLASQAKTLQHDDLRALKAVLLLDDWLSGTPGPELERRYHVYLGWLWRCARAVARGLRRLRPLARGAAAEGESLALLIQRLRRIDPDGVAEHGLSPLGRHLSMLLGALQAQDAATHLGVGTRQLSRR